MNVKSGHRVEVEAYGVDRPRLIVKLDELQIAIEFERDALSRVWDMVVTSRFGARDAVAITRFAGGGTAWKAGAGILPEGYDARVLLGGK